MRNRFSSTEAGTARLGGAMKKRMILLLSVLCVLCLLTPTFSQAEDQYTLERMVVLSRHNIRSPLSAPDSMLYNITPHTWFEWTSKTSELSLRGEVLETMMGQYFRKYLEKSGLFPANYQPADGAVRIYANAKQRTIATARYFSAGLFPVSLVPVEVHAPYDTMDPVFSPVLTFVNDAYSEDATAQIAEMGGVAGLPGIYAKAADAIALLMDVTDMEESEAYRAGTYGDWTSNEMSMIFEEGKEPRMNGVVGKAVHVADAMTLQYYEEKDAQKAAFGHDLTLQDWQKIHSVADAYTDALFTAPLVAVNVAHPLLKEIRSELSTEGRQFAFLCGHDSNVASVLAALNVKEYLLEDAVEQETPIGVKVVFERYLDKEAKAWYKVCLVYQNPEQLRSMEPLTLDNPPSIYALAFEGAPANADGMIAEEDLLKLFDDAISAYDELPEKYEAQPQENEAA